MVRKLLPVLLILLMLPLKDGISENVGTSITIFINSKGMILSARNTYKTGVRLNAHRQIFIIFRSIPKSPIGICAPCPQSAFRINNKYATILCLQL